MGKRGVPLWCNGLRSIVVTAVAHITAMVSVQSLAWELPHAVGMSKKKGGGRRPEWTFLQKEHTDGQRVHEDTQHH